jgi:phosphoglycerol transferase MdoB-like AlkP superfamily enzyme
VDIREFRNAKKRGPYTSDEAVTDKLLDGMKKAVSPMFYFVITMENHGPLHLEKVSEEEIKDYFTVAPPQSCSDLQVYLRHLRNADQQLGRLRSALQARSRPYVLVFYGEHLPSMPDVYQELGFPDGRTDYLVESSTERDRQDLDLDIAELPQRVLRLIR